MFKQIQLIISFLQEFFNGFIQIFNILTTGAYSSYISLYNVTNLPSVFLVNRNNELSAISVTYTDPRQIICRCFPKVFITIQ